MDTVKLDNCTPGSTLKESENREAWLEIVKAGQALNGLYKLEEE